MQSSTSERAIGGVGPTYTLGRKEVMTLLQRTRRIQSKQPQCNQIKKKKKKKKP